MLNSEWIPASIILKKYIGLEWKLKTVKVADIQSGKEAVPTPNSIPSNQPTQLKSNIVIPKDEKIENVVNIQKSENENPKINEITNINESVPIVEIVHQNNNNNNSECAESNEKNESKKLKQKKQKSNKNNVTNNLVQNIDETNQISTEIPKENSLDLSDPNLYAEDNYIVSDWIMVGKKNNNKNKNK